MTQYEMWQELVKAFEKHHIRYDSSVRVVDGRIRYRSHFPTMLDKEVLTFLFGEDKVDEAALALLKEHWAEGDTIRAMYERWQDIKDTK